jgi:hypothetical protein
MNAFISALSRDVTCAAAAAVISLVVAASFLQSTAEPPGMHRTAIVTVVALPPGEQA